YKKPTTLLVVVNDRDPKVFDLHQVDLLTGERKLVAQNDDSFLGFEIDNDMTVRFATKKQPDGSTQYFIAEKKGDKLTWKAWEQIAFEDADTTDIAGFAPGNRSAYWTETRGRDTGAAVELDLATKKAKALAEDPKADAGGFMFHPKTHALQAVAFTYDKL